jgi:hypothetical protein
MIAKALWEHRLLKRANYAKTTLSILMKIDFGDLRKSEKIP